MLVLLFTGDTAPGPPTGPAGGTSGTPAPRVFTRIVRRERQDEPGDAIEAALAPSPVAPLPIAWAGEYVPPQIDLIHLIGLEAARREADDEAALLALL